MQSTIFGRLCIKQKIDLRRAYPCPKKGEHYRLEEEDDLEMLFAISIADATAIDERWGMDIADGKDALVNEMMKLKKP